MNEENKPILLSKDYYFENDNGFISFDIQSNQVSIGGYDSCTSGMAFNCENIKYFHQLKSIIFALTGKDGIKF
jgi:hypothetical protein